MATIRISHFNNRPITLSQEHGRERVQPIALEFMEDPVNCDPLELLILEEEEGTYTFNKHYTH